MKKTIALILVLIFALCFAGCAHEVIVDDSRVNATKLNTDKDTDTDIGEVYMKISGMLSENEPREHEISYIADNYLIDEELVKDSECVTYNMEGGYAFSGEIVLIEAVSADGAKTVYDALETRLEDIMKQAQSYSEIDYNLAKEVKVLQKGNCVALFYSDKYSEMAEIFNK